MQYDLGFKPIPHFTKIKKTPPSGTQQSVNIDHGVNMVSTWCQHGVNMVSTWYQHVNTGVNMVSTWCQHVCKQVDGPGLSRGEGKGRAGGQYLCEPSTGRPWKCASPSTGQPSMGGNMFGGVHMGFLEMSTGVHSTLLPP